MYVMSFIGNELNSTVSSVQTYSLPPGANAFLVQAITQNVRIRGSADPTAAIGLQLKAGDPARLLRLGHSFKALQETATAYFYCQPVHVTWVDD